ncbi:hypothetical protein DFR24_2940 [Panacagrimonas perspica]|uniref:DUF2946 family protein n=1 Tax=Panacagrimonas perspica TaxID=381431 RepID=A0A4V3F5E8_9GAMM|nr:hypothetical protein [Panacagrimonas perspica]TDU28566.1 hypothetical protein DFR24_2940 [Panacagrimonas perspica]
MWRHPRLRLAFLGLVLLVGQLLEVAHAYEHPALSEHPVCQICLLGQGLDSGAPAPTIAALPVFALDAPTALELPAAIRIQRVSAHRSRGPPLVLA